MQPLTAGRASAGQNCRKSSAWLKDQQPGPPQASKPARQHWSSPPPHPTPSRSQLQAPPPNICSRASGPEGRQDLQRPGYATPSMAVPAATARKSQAGGSALGRHAGVEVGDTEGNIQGRQGQGAGGGSPAQPIYLSAAPAGQPKHLPHFHQKQLGKGKLARVRKPLGSKRGISS